MEDIRKKYNEIVNKRKEVIEELVILENSDIVSKYLRLKKENLELLEQEQELYTHIKKQSYASCKHLTIYTKVYYDYLDGKRYTSCGCMKCGLNSNVLDYDRKWLSIEERTMYDYLKKNMNFRSTSDVICDLSLAKAIYKKIKENHPGINDKLARKYFEIALDNIRSIPVNEKRKESRIKRLNLKSNFNKWNVKDVTMDE